MTYVLITPARNEAAFIEQTIQAVIRQSVKPAKWLIVSDGSTDGTDEIVKKHVHEHPWIELVRMPERAKRHFGGKAVAFNAGCDRMRHRPYDIIGNLDAGITFDADHFEFLLNKFTQDKTLGVVGTPFREGNPQNDYRFSLAD
jgi:biofilm PGA synthesis N-glycosyltransferase PgaC